MTTTKNGLVLFLMAGLGLTGAMFARARVSGLTISPQTAGEQERERLMTKGKAIFVEKCAKCHNERGDKALSSGSPLNERGLTPDAIARAVKGRLGSGTEEERRAVTLYIASLMKDADKGVPKP